MNKWKYTIDLLKKNKKISSRPLSTPVEANPKHSIKDESQSVLNEKRKDMYQCIVGKLICLTLTRPVYLTLTRPDITYAINVVN